jgi:hypothetical protein
MLSPICDGTRLVLGIIATLGGLLFASMTNMLKNDIKNLYLRLFQRDNYKLLVTEPKTSTQRTLKSLGWFLLVVSFLATFVLGPYVAYVPSQTCVNLIFSELVCNPPGDDVQGEFVTLQNLGGSRINLNNWKVCDYRDIHCYKFKTVSIQPHSSLTIWTKAGTDTATDLYFGESTPIWNNQNTDTAYLYDVKGQLIYQLNCPKE